MRIFANAFLVAFAIDALFAIAVSQSHGVGAGAPWLASVRDLLMGFVSLASIPLFVLMGIHPGLRWRIFLPPCLLLSWIMLGAMPLPIWFSASNAALVAGALEAAFAVTAFGLCRQWNRANGADGWLLGEQALRGPTFSRHTAVGFTALNLLVILPASLAYLALAAAAGVGHLTQGFVEIRSDGIHLAHREYVRGGQTIHLVAMMHIGDSAFYEELVLALPRQGAITLAEGVTDETGVLSGGLSYGNVAAELGLVEQPELSAGDRELRHADVDVSAFSRETLELLTGVGRVLGSATSTDALIAYAELSNHVGSEDPTRMIAAFRHDLIDLRNDHLLGEIETSLRDYDVVVVPWGGLHLPGIEDRVRELGFVQDAATDRRVISW